MKHMSPIPKKQLEALVALAKAGDKSSMSRLIELSEQMVYCNCRYLLKNEEEARDMAQEVFLTVFTKIETLKKAEAFFDWVKIIKINKCKNYLKQRNMYFLLEDASGKEDDTDPSSHFIDRRDQCSPEKSLDRKEVKELLLKHIDRLPDAQRLCIVLFYYDDLSLRQIAQLLNVSVGTVKSRLAYARINLRKALEKERQKGTSLYGSTPVSMLGFVAYFLKKQFENKSDAAAMETILKGSLELIEGSETAGASAGMAASQSAAGITAGGVGDTALAESAYAFATTNLSLKGLTLSALWASTAGKVVIASLVGGALIGSVFGGMKLSIPDREKQVQMDHQEEVSFQKDDQSQENESSEVSSEPEISTIEQIQSEESSFTEQNAEHVENTENAENIEITESMPEAEEMTEQIYLTESAATEETVLAAETSETVSMTGEASAEMAEPSQAQEVSASSTLQELQDTVSHNEETLSAVQTNYDNAQAAYDYAYNRAQSDLAECKAMVARELPVFRETYEARVRMNEEQSGYFSDEEVAEALQNYNDWTYYYEIVYPATLDDVRNQIFPEYFANLNDCGQQWIIAEEELAYWAEQVTIAQSELDASRDALAKAKQQD